MVEVAVRAGRKAGRPSAGCQSQEKTNKNRIRKQQLEVWGPHIGPHAPTVSKCPVRAI